MFHPPVAGRTTLILMAIDANLPVVVIAGYGLMRHSNPIAVLLAAPWLLLIVLAFPSLLAVAEMYTLRPSFWSWRCLLRSAVVTLAVVLLFGTTYYLVSDRTGARELFTVLALAMVAEVLLARSVTAFAARRERTVRSALVVGAGWAGRTVIDCTLCDPRLRIKVSGIIDDNPQKRNIQYKGVPVVGTSRQLPEAAARHAARLIVVAVSGAQNAELIKNLLQIKMRGVEVVDMPTFCEQATGQIPIRNVEDSWFLYRGGFDLLHRPLLQRVKRGIDLAAASLGLLLSLPLLALVALLVKLDSPGPVFHRQECAGQNEETFNLIKFRTMREDAQSAAAPVWASVRDYRVTRIGRWLRLTRLDEIPQFVNVLKGEMSFVGPRPERPTFVEQLKKEIPYYALRFAVKPGLTGWAQVQGHSEAAVENAVEKLKYDLYYLKNMSVFLDTWIALKTLKVVFFAQGN
jgi:exopolysaccharide biosynthesis polyprenyl glycosylphosphotransferase